MGAKFPLRFPGSVPGPTCFRISVTRHILRSLYRYGKIRNHVTFTGQGRERSPALLRKEGTRCRRGPRCRPGPVPARLPTLRGRGTAKTLDGAAGGRRAHHCTHRARLRPPRRSPGGGQSSQLPYPLLSD